MTTCRRSCVSSRSPANYEHDYHERSDRADGMDENLHPRQQRVPQGKTERDLEATQHLTATRGVRSQRRSWKKSQASIVEACMRRNCRQVDRVRCGAGGIRSRLRTLHARGQ